MALAIYEGFLAKQKYIAGDVCISSTTPSHIHASAYPSLLQEVTLADLFHVPLGEVIASVTPGTLNKNPNVSR
jgi:hypothetical protein